MFIVIGSGPAGVSAAKSLLARGVQVTMLDVGYTLEKSRQAAVETLRTTPPAGWSGDTLRSITDATQPDVKGLPKKLIYGSDYPFRHPADLLDVQTKGVDVLASHAAGGLSNVWGANLLPLLESDVAGWPVSLKELTPYYSKVLEYVPLSGVPDDLEKLFPLHTGNAAPLRASAQAQKVLASLASHREKFAGDGITFGSSRLAVRAQAGGRDGGCIYCGLCLYGCPYGLIYTSASTLEELKTYDNFKYTPGVFVERLEEQGDKVKVLGKDVSSGLPVTFYGDRVFVGAGAVPSSRIILESLDAYDQELSIRDSQYFLLPLLRYASSGNVVTEKLHTLAQVAINIRAPEVSSKSIHILEYTYNDLYLRAMKKMLGPLAGLAAPVLKPVLSRMIVMQGYLHSNDSPSIALRVSKPHGGKRQVSLEARLNPETKKTLGRMISFIRKRPGLKSGLLLTPLMHVGAPGKSYHVGASLPMKSSPGKFESDTLGRPSGFSRVHVVDSAVFPDIPATNATFSVMANAYRIAEKAA